MKEKFEFVEYRGQADECFTITYKTKILPPQSPCPKCGKLPLEVGIVQPKSAPYHMQAVMPEDLHPLEYIHVKPTKFVIEQIPETARWGLRCIHCGICMVQSEADEKRDFSESLQFEVMDGALSPEEAAQMEPAWDEITAEIKETVKRLTKHNQKGGYEHGRK